MLGHILIGLALTFILGTMALAKADGNGSWKEEQLHLKEDTTAQDKLNKKYICSKHLKSKCYGAACIECDKKCNRRCGGYCPECKSYQSLEG